MNLDALTKLSERYNVIPLVSESFNASETPLGVYRKLHDESSVFLLESAEQGVWSRFSFIGFNPRGELIEVDGKASWTGPILNFELESDPISALDQLSEYFKSSDDSSLPLQSGLVGHMSWNVVRHLEQLPEQKESGYSIPSVHFMQFREIVVLDHLDSKIYIIHNIFTDDGNLFDSLAEGTKRLREIRKSLKRPSTAEIYDVDFAAEDLAKTSMTKSEFKSMVERAKEHVIAGDVFQVVVSQRFTQDLNASADEVYAVLRALNPSPYMYLLQLSDNHGPYWIVGSSPEALVKINQRKIISHPIAGSRPRGKDPVSDSDMEKELVADTKEQSEHLMLVDLARNDLLRSCEPSTVAVEEFMAVHRYSHIMHLVSTVVGKLREGVTRVSAVTRAFPAGTLSGAPKPRALEIIEDLEPINRGLFGGVVGYFDFQGNADLAIAIRTALIRGNQAFVQAGAGIVLDSDPESEYLETLAKARVIQKAISIANSRDKN
jgi:anthranilate synthase component 1